MKKNLIFWMVLLAGVCFMGISTASACDCYGTGTPGYWKNKGAKEGWPVDTICLDGNGVGPDAGRCFDKEEALEILNMPVRRDKSITMFKAYIAAALNVAMNAGNGRCEVPVCDHPFYGRITLQTAANWLELFPVESGVRAETEPWQYSHGEAIYFCLDEFNNGGPGGLFSRDCSDDGTYCSQ